MVITIDTEKAFSKIQHPFMIIKKNLGQNTIERKLFKIIKAVHDKTTPNVIVNGENLKAFHVRSETKQGFPLTAVIR